MPSDRIEPPSDSEAIDRYRWCDVTADVFDVFDQEHDDHDPHQHHRLYVADHE